MSIGETLAQARRRAGLTLSEVSQRTRIREALIRDIERDDYSATGGDFYTRGHIRAIARVVGADPGPLIEEYDVARRPPSPEDPAAWHDLLVEHRPGGPDPGPAATAGYGPPWREPAGGQGPSAGGPAVGPGALGGEEAGGYRADDDPESTLDHGPLWRELPPRDGAAWDEPPSERDEQWDDPRPGRAAPADEAPAEHTARWDEPSAGQTAQWDQPPAGRTAQWRDAAGGPFRTEPATGPPGPAGPPGPVISLGGEEDAPRAGAGAPFRGARPMPLRTQRRRNMPLLVGVVLVVVLGLLGYFFIANTGGSPGGTPAAGGPTAGSGRSAAGGRAGGAARTVVVHLTAVKDTSVVFTTPRGGYLFRSNVAAGTSKRWTFSHPVRMRLADPGGVRLAVDGKNPLPAGSARPVTLSLSPGHPATVTAAPGRPTPRASTPAPPVASQPLTPASAAAFGPSGGQGDNPAEAQLAIDGKTGTAWNTDWYTSANFGNLYPGTGLLLDMGRPVTITGAQITLGGSAGAALQLRAGSAPTLAALSPVARASGASGTVRLQPATPAHARYLLIWFTKLPLTSAGNYEASVQEVKVEGHS